MLDSRQIAIGERIVELVRDLNLDFINDGDVRLESYAITTAPGTGVIVSPLREQEASRLNNLIDITYPYVVVYCESGTGIYDNVDIKSRFRQAILDRFHRKRIGLPVDLGCCEIVTHVTHDDMEVKREWIKNNRDYTLMVVNVTVRF
jgi:hypothetical protein